MELQRKNPIEIYVDGSNNNIKKNLNQIVYSAVIQKKLVEYKGKLVCDKCFKKKYLEIKEAE